MISALINLFRRAAWAPIAVLIFHAIVAETPFRKPLDFAMHFSGGAAIAYFLFEAQDCFRSVLGTLRSGSRSGSKSNTKPVKR